MYKIGVVLLGFVVAGIIAVSGAISGEGSDGEMSVPLGTITIEPPDSIEAKRSAVEFPHSLHFNFKCSECHHTWKGDAEIQGCMTSGCHDGTISPLKAKQEGQEAVPAHQYFKQAYHSQCIGCHKNIKAENKKMEKSILSADAELLPSGQTGCVQCHPREE